MCGSNLAPFLQAANQAFQRLADASALECHAGPNHGQVGGLRAEHGARPIRTHNLVVAHVDDPKVAVLRGAIPGDGEDNVGIDGGHGRVDDFKMFIGKASL